MLWSSASALVVLGTCSEGGISVPSKHMLLFLGCSLEQSCSKGGVFGTFEGPLLLLTAATVLLVSLDPWLLELGFECLNHL